VKIFFLQQEKSNMNILFHVHKLSLGGAERQLFYLVKELIKFGVKPYVVTLYPGGKIWDELQEYQECTLHCLERKGRFDFTIIYKLARYIKNNNIDLVQGWMPPCNTFSMLAGVLSLRPVLLGIRTSNMIYQESGGNFYNKLDAIISRFFAKKVICNSYAGMDFHQKIGFPRKKLMVIPNGIDTQEFLSTGKISQLNGKVNLGMISRIDPVKSHITALEACKILKEKNANCTLYIYGGGDYVLEEKLKEYVIENGLEEYVNFCGWTENVHAIFPLMQVYISTSSYGEGMSNSLMEAMASGRIIISTDVGDAKLILNGEFGDAGYIIQPRDPHELAETIINITENFYEAKNKAIHAREIIKNNFSVTKMGVDYWQLYKILVKNI